MKVEWTSIKTYDPVTLEYAGLATVNVTELILLAAEMEQRRKDRARGR
jgi:hypothetical protein